MVTRAMYLTAAELINAPTGVDWSSIPARGASTTQQTAEQNNLIRRATAWVDQQTDQKLQATVDTTVPLGINSDRCRWNPDGTLSLRLDYFPIVSVTSLALSFDGSTWATVSPPWPTFVETQQMIKAIPSSGVAITGSPGIYNNGWARATYVDGYANALLTANASASATAIVVDDATGITAGQLLTIYDGVTQEDVTVASSYTATTGTATVNLAAALAYAHVSGARVSAIPVAVREATILVSAAWARQRGRGALTVNEAGGGRVARASASRDSDFAHAEDLLRSFKRWG